MELTWPIRWWLLTTIGVCPSLRPNRLQSGLAEVQPQAEARLHLWRRGYQEPVANECANNAYDEIADKSETGPARFVRANQPSLRATETGTELIPPGSGRSCGDRSELSGLLWRARARLDLDCLGGLYDLRGLLDREMQHALVEMSVDGSVLWLEWQGHRSVE